MNNTADGQYSLGKSKNTFAQIWDLIEAQIDQKLTSNKGATEVQVNMKASQTSVFERVQPYARGARGARDARVST